MEKCPPTCEFRVKEIEEKRIELAEQLERGIFSFDHSLIPTERANKLYELENPPILEPEATTAPVQVVAKVPSNANISQSL